MHLHEFLGKVYMNFGHTHEFSGKTNEAPDTLNHIHVISIKTCDTYGHYHYINGITGISILLPDGNHYHPFFGMTTLNGEYLHSHKYSGETNKKEKNI